MSTRGMMGRSAVAFLLVAAALAPTDAAAQDYDSSAGFGGGYMSYAPFVSSGDHSPQDIGVSSTWVALLQAETWELGRWLGLRAGGSFTHGDVSFPTASRSVSVYGLEAAALLRVLPPVPGRGFSAYLLGGGGSTWFAFGSGGTVPIAGTNIIYEDGDRQQYTLSAGGGLEFMTGLRSVDSPLGVRLEAVNQRLLGGPFRHADGSEVEPMDNLRFSVVLFSAVRGF